MINRITQGFCYWLLLCILVCFQLSVTAQKKNTAELLKIYEDDDFLNFRGEGTDRGYTSGLKIELYYTKNKPVRFPSNLLMKAGKNADNFYGWGLNQNMYAPLNIAAAGIQYGDRPYCGLTYFSHLLISADQEKNQKLTTGISLGVMGKYSYAGDIQSWFHSLIHYTKPKGWDNQIKTDLILNYSILYERLLFSPTANLEIIGSLQANAGTLYNNMGLGLQFRAGLFNNYFSNYERKTFQSANQFAATKKFQCFFYMKTQGTAVMDDATLQGGFFSHRSSPYVIPKDSINRFYMQYEYGITIVYKRFGVNIAEKLRTPEFTGTYAQQIGNLTFYIGL